MRAGELVFVDAGAWIVLALTRDPLHARACEAWAVLAGNGARLHTSVPTSEHDTRRNFLARFNRFYAQITGRRRDRFWKSPGPVGPRAILLTPDGRARP